ncbi:hypothetical protein CN918_28350 [Priestia megaterium]|nr:hypothetical protein CN918_28350 [Priestia megaterium]
MTFTELHNQKPTLQWKQRMEEGDDLFTDEILAETDKVLTSFLNELEGLSQPTEGMIFKSVECVVLALNELNESYDDFIETQEREELYLFIVEAAKIAGLESDEDITEDYREW